MLFAKNRRKNADAYVIFLLLFFFFVGRKLRALTLVFIGLHLRLPPGTESKVFATQMGQRVVETQYGRLRGILVTPPDPALPQVEAYLGLEYASLLGGELRFMAPTSPVGRWKGVRQALKFKPVCPQLLPDLREMRATMSSARFERWKRLVPFLERQQEECLNLNVYVPFRDSNDTRLLPVVLFIHGESYDTGTGNAYDGSILAAFGQIVVITINYRLGVLGFLTTGDIHAPGNFGLLDQVAALHWIADNIRVFGGDPSQVTLMGHGHGAALVHLLLASPITSGKELFKRAILQSGSALSRWAFAADPLRYTKELSRRLNCSSQDSLLVVQCLKQYSYEILVSVPVTREKYKPTFGPNVDGRTVLPVSNSKRHTPPGTGFEGHPAPQYPTLGTSGAGSQTVPPAQQTNSCPLVFGATSLLLGVLSHEGYRYFSDEDLSEGLSEVRWVRTLRTFVQNVFRYHLQKIYDILAHNYHDWDHPKDRQAIGRGLVELLGDGLFAAPVIELAQRHVACNSAAAATSTTFLYSFVRDRETVGNGSHGAQGDELSAVFGAPLADGIDPFGSRFSTEDKRLSEVVMTYWVNFIRSGNPNGEDHRDETKAVVEWPPYDSQDQPYLLINNTPVVHHHYKSRKMALWLELIPKIHRPDPSPNPLIHLLHDFRNRSTFEDRGTRQIDLSDLADQSNQLPPASTALDSLETPSNHMEAPSPFYSTLPNHPHRVTSPMSRKSRITSPQIFSHTQRTSETLAQTSFTPLQDPYESLDSEGEGPTEGTDFGTLKVTLAIGLGLLLLNLTVFGATFYQWRHLDRASGLCTPAFVDKSPLDATSNHRSSLRYDAVSASYLAGVGKDSEPTPPYDGTPTRARFGCEDTAMHALDKDITMNHDSCSVECRTEFRTKDGTEDRTEDKTVDRTEDSRIENHVAYPSTEV